jgi:hypothetical protein
MPLEKKPPRFVPTLTEVVPGRPQPTFAPVERDSEVPTFEGVSSDGSECSQVMAAAEQYMAQRMPGLVAQHMAACEAELRRELEAVIKNLLADKA